MIRLLFISILVITAFPACNNEQGKKLSNEKMQALMWDVLVADAYAEQFIKKDSSKNLTVENEKLYRQIFDIHKIRKEDFEITYSYYKNHPGEMKTLMDSVTAFAERNRREMMMKKYAKPVLEIKK